MRWLYLYLSHDPRGASSSGARPSRRTQPHLDDLDTATLTPIRPGAFARWATTSADSATAPRSSRPAPTRLGTALG